MTLRRARPGSPTEITESKRRSTFVEPFEEFTFCEDAISPIDELFAYCGEEPYCDKDRSIVYRLFNERSVKFLEAEILKDQSDFLDTAKLLMKDFLKLVEDNQPISGEDAEILLRGVWLNSCFVRSLGAAIAEDRGLMGYVMCYSNQDSVADRTAHMEADPYFKISVMGLKEPTSTSTFLRLFLSILIGHWCDKDLLRELDNGMGKNVFGRHMDMIARVTERAGKKYEVEDFSFDIDDASDAKDLEPLRKLLVSRYGQREDRDIEAILKEKLPEVIPHSIIETLPLRTFLHTPNGENWVVGMEYRDEKVFMTNGWTEFVIFNNIGAPFFVIFTPAAFYSFDVVICTPDGVELSEYGLNPINNIEGASFRLELTAAQLIRPRLKIADYSQGLLEYVY